MFFTSINYVRSKAVAFLFLLFPLSVHAQVVKSGRWEVPLATNDFTGYQVVSANEMGLVLYRSLMSDEGPQIEITRLDTALHEVWHGFIATEQQLNLLYAQVHENVFSVLLKGSNYASGDFMIINIKLDKGNYTKHLVKNAIPFNPTQYTLTSTAALIGGYFNYRPLVVHFSFTTQQSKILPGFFNEPGELNQINTNTDGTIDIVVSAKNFERKKCLWMRNYDSEGTLVKTIVLTPDDKKSLIFGRSVKSAGGEQIVSGVYGRYADYSRGVFVAVINTMGEYTIRYYSFADLHNFFRYMKASREKRILNRIQRRKVKGKKTKFNYRMMVHNLIPYNDQFVMLGEAFYPHYSYPNRGFNYAGFNSLSRYGNTPLTREGMVFDGYQYTHAVVIGFDNNGKLTWDNSFEINDVRSMQLEQFVKIQAEKERIILLYLHENILRSKIIKGSEVIEGKNEDDLTAESGRRKSRERTRGIEIGHLDHWYGSYFFSFGVQSLKNSPETGPARKVFFINKITYK